MKQKNGMIVGIFSLVIAVIIVMGVMTPVVSDWTTGERIENEGAGWLRMSYESSPSYQSIAADLSGEGVEITNDRDGTPNGTETLSGTEDTIIYADNNLALWYENDTLFLLGQIDGEPVFVQRNDAISLIRESDGIRVSAADTPTITFPFPTYAYEPNSDGNYAFFANDTPVKTESGMPNAIIGGGFAGVYAYNDIYRYNGLGLYMHPVYDDDGLLNGAYWDKTAPVESESLDTDALNPSAIDLNPITLTPSASLMAVPTPTYTDGDWGYELTTVDGVQKAVIVSYSGSGGNIVVPATVGGYDVYRLGKDLPTSGYPEQNVFDNSALSNGSTLTISDGIKEIGGAVCRYCTNIAGSLIIPDSVTAIGAHAFQGCRNLTGSLTIPDGVLSISRYAFQTCTGFKGTLTIPDSVTSIGTFAFYSGGYTGALVISSNVTSIGASAFQNCNSLTSAIIASNATPDNNALSMSGITEILDLSDTVDYSVDRYGMPVTATVSDNIGDCFGFISVVEIESAPLLTGPIATLLTTIPLLMVVGLVIAAIGYVRMKN